MLVCAGRACSHSSFLRKLLFRVPPGRSARQRRAPLGSPPPGATPHTSKCCWARGSFPPPSHTPAQPRLLVVRACVQQHGIWNWTGQRGGVLALHEQARQRLATACCGTCITCPKVLAVLGCQHPSSTSDCCRSHWPHVCAGLLGATHSSDSNINIQPYQITTHGTGRACTPHRSRHHLAAGAHLAVSPNHVPKQRPHHPALTTSL